MKDNTVVKKGQAEMSWLIKQYIENYQMSNINRTKTLDELRYPGRETVPAPLLFSKLLHLIYYIIFRTNIFVTSVVVFIYGIYMLFYHKRFNFYVVSQENVTLLLSVLKVKYNLISKSCKYVKKKVVLIYRYKTGGN